MNNLRHQINPREFINLVCVPTNIQQTRYLVITFFGGSTQTAMILKLLVLLQWAFLKIPESEGYELLWRSVPANVDDIMAGSYVEGSVSSLIQCDAIAAQTYNASLACFDGSRCLVGIGDLQAIRGPLKPGWNCMTTSKYHFFSSDSYHRHVSRQHSLLFYLFHTVSLGGNVS